MHLASAEGHICYIWLQQGRWSQLRWIAYCEAEIQIGITTTFPGRAAPTPRGTSRHHWTGDVTLGCLVSEIRDVPSKHEQTFFIHMILGHSINSQCVQIVWVVESNDYDTWGFWCWPLTPSLASEWGGKMPRSNMRVAKVFLDAHPLPLPSAFHLVSSRPCPCAPRPTLPSGRPSTRGRVSAEPGVKCCPPTGGCGTSPSLHPQPPHKTHPIKTNDP